MSFDPQCITKTLKHNSLQTESGPITSLDPQSNIKLGYDQNMQ